MAFIGLDCHKRFIQVATVARPSKSADRSYAIRTDKDAIRSFARSLSPEDSVVLENSGNAHGIAALLKENTKARITISNPMANKVISTSKVKTDKVDALSLANLHAVNYIPDIWQPDFEIAALRRLIAYHQSISRQKVLVKNRIHAVLQRNLVPDADYYDRFCRKARKYLLNVSLPQDEKQQMKEEIALLDCLEKRTGAIMKRIAKRVVNDADVRRLLTITGIGLFNAVTLKSAIGNIQRFDSPKKLVGYFGLGSAIYQSADTCHTGRITKRGNIHARSALVQAAQTVVRYPSPLRAFFRRLYARKGRNKAIIAVAAKMTRIVWFMLKRKEDYRYILPKNTHTKLVRLRYLAYGKSSKSKVAEGKGNGRAEERKCSTGPGHCRTLRQYTTLSSLLCR